MTPATGGNGVPLVFGHAAFDLADVGYTRSEFFIEGTASAYAPVNPLTSNGLWTVAPSASAAYKTRIVVNRPINAADFNGTVLVEWFNVSGLADASPDWQHMHVELVRDGLCLGGRLRSARRRQSAQVRRSEPSVLPGCRRSGALRVVGAPH